MQATQRRGARISQIITDSRDRRMDELIAENARLKQERDEVEQRLRNLLQRIAIIVRENGAGRG